MPKLIDPNWKENIEAHAAWMDETGKIATALLLILPEYFGKSFDWRVKKKVAALVSDELQGRKVWFEDVNKSHMCLHVGVLASHRGSGFNQLIGYFSEGLKLDGERCTLALNSWAKQIEQAKKMREDAKEIAKNVALIGKQMEAMRETYKALESAGVSSDIFTERAKRQRSISEFLSG